MFQQLVSAVWFAFLSMALLNLRRKHAEAGSKVSRGDVVLCAAASLISAAAYAVSRMEILDLHVFRGEAAAAVLLYVVYIPVTARAVYLLAGQLLSRK